MSLVFESSEFFIELRILLESKEEINWLILKDLSKFYSATPDVSLSFFEGGRTFDLPFQEHLGYLNVTSAGENDFKAGFAEIVAHFKNKTIATANIFILFTRISGSNELLSELLIDFKNIVGQDCPLIYKSLVASLNGIYFKHHHLSKKTPKTAQDWLDIFRSAEGFSDMGDPVVRIIDLVPNENNRHLDYHWISYMSPLLRATLMGWYNFQLDADSLELISIINSNESEASYIAATILDDIVPDRIAPVWLTNDIIRIFMWKYWLSIGKDLFIHVYGISYRNKHENQLFKSLKNSLHEILAEILLKEDDESELWITKFDFPTSYIAPFTWMGEKKN